MENTQEVIKQIWAAEQEILDVIHEVCTAHGLRYTLAYGTLIGAVRHDGFIPWDDDIDLMMPREDYERLLSIWNDVAPEGYLLQNIRTDSDDIKTFSKIRKDHTTFLQFEFERDVNYHKGVFVDIFPADRVADGKIANTLQYIDSAVNLLYTRGFRSGAGGIIGLTEKVLLALPKKLRPMLRRLSEAFIRRWNGREELRWFSPSTIISAKLIDISVRHKFLVKKLFMFCSTFFCFCAEKKNEDFLKEILKRLDCAPDRAQTNTFYLIDFEKFIQIEFPKLQKFLQNRFNERWLI